jgi:hypothetical protein
MPNYDPAMMAYMLRSQDPNSVVRTGEMPINIDPNSVVRAGEMPIMRGNKNGNVKVPPNFVPPNINAFPKMRQGDEELLKQYGMTPEEFYNFQAQLR